MQISDFDYSLPEKLIAIHPPKERGNSRMLVLNSQTGHIEHKNYQDMVDYLKPGDLVVLNDTKVIKARLVATNSSGQTRELLLLEDHHNTDFSKRQVVYRGKIRPKEVLMVKDTEVVVESVDDGGIANISSHINLLELAEHQGTVPLPPYMHRDATEHDVQRYQTVFAKQPGSVAAPTASLNFTNDLIAKLTKKGVHIAYLTLHVGLGTFLPIRTDNIEEHNMHSEYFVIPKETAELIQKTKLNSGKIVAVGTTVARTLEFTATKITKDIAGPISGEANIFIYPGYNFKIVDTLLTNFHAPKSTVLMMAAAKAGWQNLEHAYQEAINQEYAFLSYGDSMLII